MSAEYSREILQAVIAKICQTIGWHGIQSTPLDVMIDIMRRYMVDLARTAANYAVQFGRTQPNLDELGLAFRDMHINIADLQEYINYVDSSPAVEVPQYPVKRESHLNFLKPGSHEVVTRPVHIYEYLPPMLPEVKEEPVTMKTEDEPMVTTDSTSQIFKRPADISPGEHAVKRPRVIMEEEGRPTREISSVMMTTSGFLSPAREGKLPEARTPISTMESSSNSLLPSNSFEQNMQRKIQKSAKDKKIDKAMRILMSPVGDIGPKKYTSMKDVVRLKALKANVANNTNQPLDHPIKPITPKTPQIPKTPKVPPKVMRPEKTSPPALPPKPTATPDKFVEGKISSEPDKSKLNIFKKISKVKDDKTDKIEKTKIKEEPKDGVSISRESSPDLIIDETEKNWDQKVSIKQEIIIKQEPIEKPVKLSPPREICNNLHEVKNSPPSEKDFLYDDDSPPGTPSTPKTPEMLTHSPPLKPDKEVKRKRKDKSKAKNKSKIPKYSMSPRRNKNESFDGELDRPKTPNDPVNIKEEPIVVPPPPPPVQAPVFPFFPGYIPGPGLIPSPIFPRLPLAAGMPKHGFGQPAHIHPVMPSLPFVPPIKPPPPEEIQEKPPTPVATETQNQPIIKQEPPSVPKEKHKKDKKDKIKKKNKKDKIKNKTEKRKLKEEKKEKEKDKIKREKKEKKKEKEREQHEGSVPKLTLKIGSPRPPTPDVQVARKIMIKPVVKKEEEPVILASAVSNEPPEKREPSPELARISALITRPPKLKTSKEAHGSKEESGTQQSSTSPKPSGPLPGRSRLNTNLSKGPSVANSGPIAGVKAGPGKQKPVVLKQQPSSVVDNDGNKVWICPGCGGQDDGSPMIGCDDCDAWYHWVCVGIQVPPDDNEDWYCRICIVKKQETLQIDKKKKRKKKEKKEH